MDQFYFTTDYTTCKKGKSSPELGVNSNFL